jgi:hypothetical protein
VQGAVLADLSAIWLTGHMVPGDVEATRSVRAELLAYQCQTIRALVIAGEMEYGWSDPRRN